MTTELEGLAAEQAVLMQSIRYREEARDVSRIAYFKQLLDQLDVVDTSLLSIFDMSVQDHVYFSRKYAAVLGWDLEAAHDQGVAYVNQRFHPEDMLYLSRAGVFFMKWALEQPVETRRDFKHVARYRMLDGQGNYVPVVEQQSVLELDADGNIWLVLSVIDRAPDDEKFTGATSRAMNVKTGAVIEPLVQDNHGISPREREIMQLVASGMASKQVAEALFLSVHTVNTHRQRILSKTGTSSMTEAVRWAMERGLLT